MDEALRAELLALAREDQIARGALAGARERMTRRSVHEIGRRNTARMMNIVHEHGWPGRSVVGEDGAHAAWPIEDVAGLDASSAGAGLGPFAEYRKLMEETVRRLRH